MARQITRELAEKIAKKLDAQVETSGGAHSIAYIFLDGVLVAQFGIRRGSEKDKGHDHIPDEIFVGPNKAKRLGQCPMSKKQWIEHLREIGRLPAESKPETETKPKSE